MISCYIFFNYWYMIWNLCLQSGQAFTPIIGYYNQILPEGPDEVYRTIPGTRNSARYKPYSRLDLGIVYHTKLFGSKMDIYVQVINVFNRKNTFRKTYNVGSIYKINYNDGDRYQDKHESKGKAKPHHRKQNVDESDEGRLQVNNISLFPIIPTIGFSWEF